MPPSDDFKHTPGFPSPWCWSGRRPVRPGHTILGLGPPSVAVPSSQAPAEPTAWVDPAEADFEPCATAHRDPSSSRSWASGAGQPPPPPSDTAGEACDGSRGDLVLVEPAFTVPPSPLRLHLHSPHPVADPSPDLVMLCSPNCAAAQQFRTLRYRIEQLVDLRVIAVTSPRASEGKSVTAANLALALAEGGRVKVLLVDAALRSPSQARLFGLGNPVGLTYAIETRRIDPQAPIDLVLLPNGLHLLPAGPRVANPYATLASEPAAHVLASLRRSFRFVIIDASAVLESGETLAFHRWIDGYILLARRGMTTTDDLAKAADRLDRNRVLGVSFVAAPLHRAKP